jgi:uncharacterized protein (DUF433 family)
MKQAPEGWRMVELSRSEGDAMSDDQLLARITLNPDVLAGKPVIAGTRLSVEFILNLLGHGSTEQDILAEYPRLTSDDVRACLLFAARFMRPSGAA